ncbi:type VI secretion system baseplate subunit TssF [Cytophagaceae bacterium ABcell3]|nr:type VI secretion system baseplate subunit TssF [Cytophagaceae bacterium ABcell3]
MSEAIYKEDIKGRMLRHVAALWGVKNTEALDPIVRLLVEGLAGELHKTHQEIHTFEKRILEKIALLLTPGILSCPYPAHAVAKAVSVEPSDMLSDTTYVSYSKKSGAGMPESSFNFTPVGQLKIFNAEVSNLLIGNKLYAVDDFGQKTLLANGQSYETQNRNIWVGVKLHAEIKDIDRLNLFFDLKNTDSKRPLFQVLHAAEFYINGHKINTTKGVVYDEKIQEGNLFSEYDPTVLIEREVKHLYDDHFVSIRTEKQKADVANLMRYFPEELEDLFLPSELEDFRKDRMLWIQVLAPSNIEDRILHDFQISCNAFPVVNRLVKRQQQRLKGINNVMPFKTEGYEFFLSVKSLTDSTNKQYKQIPYTEADQRNIGSYSVRMNGTERIDARGAREFLLYLADLIRDEAAAFSTFGQDTVNSAVKDIERLLAQIGQRINKNSTAHQDSCQYVTVEYQKKSENFHLEYWVTNSVYANGIHAGSILKQDFGSAVKNNSCILLTNTRGGKRALEPSRHIEAYKYAMLSHNKIVTAEDIKAFCMYELGDKISSVSVKKGLMVSENPAEGLVRCVEVHLKKKRRSLEAMEENEWQGIINNFKSKMELRSSLNLSFKIVLVD